MSTDDTCAPPPPACDPAGAPAAAPAPAPATTSAFGENDSLLRMIERIVLLVAPGGLGDGDEARDRAAALQGECGAAAQAACDEAIARIRAEEAESTARITATLRQIELDLDGMVTARLEAIEQAAAAARAAVQAKGGEIEERLRDRVAELRVSLDDLAKGTLELDGRLDAGAARIERLSAAAQATVDARLGAAEARLQALQGEAQAQLQAGLETIQTDLAARLEAATGALQLEGGGLIARLRERFATGEQALEGRKEQALAALEQRAERGVEGLTASAEEHADRLRAVGGELRHGLKDERDGLLAGLRERADDLRERLSGFGQDQRDRLREVEDEGRGRLGDRLRDLLDQLDERRDRAKREADDELERVRDERRDLRDRLRGVRHALVDIGQVIARQIPVVGDAISDVAGQIDDAL